MKEQKPENVQKPVRQGQSEEAEVASTESKVGASFGNGTRSVTGSAEVRSLTGQKPPRPETTMHSEPSHHRKPRGRLTRDAMKIIGKTLEAYYEDVRKEGTPDRFKQLLQQFDERKGQKDKESS